MTLHAIYIIPEKSIFYMQKRNLKTDGILKQSEHYFEMFECKGVYNISITFMSYTHRLSS